MYPVLFSIGPFTLHTYGLLIAIGFLIAVRVIEKLAVRSKLDVQKVLSLTFRALLIGFAGARLLFVFTRWNYFQNDFLGIFKVWEGGLVFYGGPITVLTYLFFYFKRPGAPSSWKVMDVMTPGLVIAHAFGRLGCFGAGCCYGSKTEMPWGVRFQSELVDRDFRGIPLHPTQLYEAASLLILFFGLMHLSKKKQFDGQVVLTYLMAYPIVRSVVEIFRGDIIRGFVIDGVLSTSQFISILVFILALGLAVYRSQGAASVPKKAKR